jgi:hypothetical protein
MDEKRHVDPPEQLPTGDGDDPDHEELTPERKLIVWKGAHAIAEDERDKALRDAADWERIAGEWELDFLETMDERDAAQSDLRRAEAKVSSLDHLLDLARQNSTLDAADLDEALAEATRLADVLTEQWAAVARLETENDVISDQCDDLRREVIAVHAEVPEQLAAARRRAVQDYVLDGAAGDAWLTVGQVRRALDEADTGREAVVARAGDLEPANGTTVVDGMHIAWQRRDSDADGSEPELRWFEAGSEQACDWPTVTASGPVTVVWAPPLLVRSRRVAVDTPVVEYITNIEADLAELEDLE